MNTCFVSKYSKNGHGACKNIFYKKKGRLKSFEDNSSYAKLMKIMMIMTLITVDLRNNI